MGVKIRTKPNGRTHVENTNTMIGRTLNGTKLYEYGSKLAIPGIKKQNFGLYACVQNIVTRGSSNKNIVNILKLEMHRYMLTSYRLLHDKKRSSKSSLQI